MAARFYGFFCLRLRFGYNLVLYGLFFRG